LEQRTPALEMAEVARLEKGKRIFYYYLLQMFSDLFWNLWEI